MTTVAVVAFALATLRITDDHQGKVELPVGRSRAFQLTAEEAHVVSDMVTSMYLHPTLFYYLFVCLMCLWVYRDILSERRFDLGSF